MKWIYRNNTKHIIGYRNYTWLPDEQHELSFPVPVSLGLTCIQLGSVPDPVLFHDDVVVAAGSSACIEINPPALSHNVSLNIQCMIQSSGVECRFNHSDNNPVPIDVRGFSQVMEWELCSRIFLSNSTDTEAIISISAIEAVS